MGHDPSRWSQQLELILMTLFFWAVYIQCVLGLFLQFLCLKGGEKKKKKTCWIPGEHMLQTTRMCRTFGSDSHILNVTWIPVPPTFCWLGVSEGQYQTKGKHGEVQGHKWDVDSLYLYQFLFEECSRMRWRLQNQSQLKPGGKIGGKKTWSWSGVSWSQWEYVHWLQCTPG